MPKINEDTPMLRVKIFSPTKTYFNGEAESVSAFNETGAFDILPMHHNFISLLSPGDITVMASNGTKSVYPTQQSLLHASKDTVTVFIDV